MTLGHFPRRLMHFLGTICISSALGIFGLSVQYKQTPDVVAAIWVNSSQAVHGGQVGPSDTTPGHVHPPGKAINQVLPSVTAPGQVRHPGMASSQVNPSTMASGQVHSLGGAINPGSLVLLGVTCTIYAGTPGKWVVCTLYADTQGFGSERVTCTIYAGTQGKWVICTLYADTQVSQGGWRSYAAGFFGSSGSSARHGSPGSSARHGSSGSSVRHGLSGSSVRHGSSGSSARHGSSGLSVRRSSSGSLVRHGSSGSSVHHASSGVPGSLVLLSVTVLLQHSGGCLLPTQWSIRPGHGQVTPGRGQAIPGPWPAAPGPGQATPGPGQAIPGPGQATLGPRPAIPGPGQTTPGPGRARLTLTHDSNTILSYMSRLLSLVLNVMTWNLLARATAWARGSPGRDRHGVATHTQSPQYEWKAIKL